MPRNNNREELRSKLMIDEDNLDRDLVEHAEYFQKAGEAVVEASALVATLKLELDELTATLDRDIRANAVREETKLTETGLSNMIKTTPLYQNLVRRGLDARKALDDCTLLKESFQQRSYLLREINQRQVARMYTMSTERGNVNSRRNALGDTNRAQLEERALQARSRRPTSGDAEAVRPERYRRSE